MGKTGGSYPKKLGTSRERGVMAHLREMGALDVTRSYSSEGIFDVRAIFPDKTLLIQVKADSIPKKELAGLIEFSKKLTARNIVVMLWKYRKKRRAWEIFELAANPMYPLSLDEFKRAYAPNQTVLMQ